MEDSAEAAVNGRPVHHRGPVVEAVVEVEGVIKTVEVVKLVGKRHLLGVLAVQRDVHIDTAPLLGRDRANNALVGAQAVGVIVLSGDRLVAKHTAGRPGHQVLVGQVVTVWVRGGGGAEADCH
eukprot:scaffold282099_cov39-Prasinocladus_malaysianus.AAC.1